MIYHYKIYSKTFILVLFLFVLFMNMANSLNWTLATGMQESSLWFSGQQTYPSIVEAGDRDVTLQIDIYHRGSKTYRNVTMEIGFQEPFTAIKDSFYLPEIHPKETYTATFRFNVGQVDPGVYTLPIAFEYYDTSKEGEVYSTRDVQVQVSATTKLEVTRIEVDPLAYVGEEFEITFYVHNKGGLTSPEVTANISSDQGAYITWVPEEQIIRYIPSNSIQELKFKGIVSEKSVPGPYSAALTLDYGGSSNVSNIFVIDLYGKPTLTVAGVATDENPSAGKKISLSIQLENTGTGDARSAKVSLQDSALRGNLESFIGTIEIDDTGSAVFDVALFSTGSYPIPILIEYESNDGNSFIIEETITLFVYSGPGLPIVEAIGFLIVMGIVYKFLPRKQKTRIREEVKDIKQKLSKLRKSKKKKVE